MSRQDQELTSKTHESQAPHCTLVPDTRPYNERRAITLGGPISTTILQVRRIRTDPHQDRGKQTDQAGVAGKGGSASRPPPNEASPGSFRWGMEMIAG